MLWLNRLKSRLAPLLFTPQAAITIVVLVFSAVVLFTCCRPTSVPQGALDLLEVPTIRVRLTGRMTESVTLSTTGGYSIYAGGELATRSSDSLSPTRVVRTPTGWKINRMTLRTDTLELVSSNGGLVRLGERAYRGRFVLVPSDRGRGLIVINHLDLESYLAGVLANELYRSWSPATYRALAVAARTFARYQMMTFGANHRYDLGATQASQVYKGADSETSKSWDAVNFTRGVVLVAGPPGQEKIFMAQYSSCCGGRVNPAEVLRNAPPLEPLRGGQVCEDCLPSPQYRWEPVRLSASSVLSAVAAVYRQAERLDRLAEIKVASNTDHGRMLWLDIVGENGESIRIRADDLRLALLRHGSTQANRLYSMNCKIRVSDDYVEFYDGRGFGHGVGLCQWGAEGKAQKGFSAVQILDFYYPGAKLYRIY